MFSKEFREIFIFILIRHVRANKVIVTTNITFCDQQIWCKHGAPRCSAWKFHSWGWSTRTLDSNFPNNNVCAFWNLFLS